MKRRQIVDIVWNLVIVASIVGAVIWYFVGNHVDAVGSSSLQSFRYFTTDSNLMIAIASLIWLICEIVLVIMGKENAPTWIRVLRYTATTAGLLTFTEVTLFMAPMAFFIGGISKALSCYGGNIFVLHFSAPIMMAISFVKSDYNYIPTKAHRLIATSPAAIYALVYLIMVVITKRWPDFYGFTFGGRLFPVPIVIIVILSVTYIIAGILKKLKTKNR